MTEYAELIWDENEEERSVFLEQLAPIVLFTYNRLEHTKRTIEALHQNIYAADSHLIIFSDGPKNSKITKSVIAVREYLSTIKGFKSIKIIERNDNWGLAKNIIDGVTSIINQYGKIIVLEDDIVTSRYFLKYMNDALKIYEYEKKVVMVNGYVYPIEKDDFLSCFFVKIGGCWGWATWKERWDHFSRDPEKIRQSFSAEDIYHFNFDGNGPSRFRQIEQNCAGVLRTWAIFFDVVVFFHGMSLNPPKPLSCNCGMDGTGEHCGVASIFDVVLADEPIHKFPLSIEENETARARIAAFYHKIDYVPWWRYLLHWVKVKCFGNLPLKEILRGGEQSERASRKRN